MIIEFQYVTDKPKHDCLSIAFNQNDTYVHVKDKAINAFEKGPRKNMHIEVMRVTSLTTKYMIVHLLTKYLYTFDKYKTNNSSRKKYTFYVHDKENMGKHYTEIFDLIHTNFMIRDIANEPANIMTPMTLANAFKRLFKGIPNVKMELVDDKHLQKQGFNLIHAVGKASKNKPVMVKITYSHPKSTKTFALIGKGVTFDAGGLNIKTGNRSGFEMKGDKTGACVAAGITYYLAKKKVPCKIVCILPLVENIISSDVLHAGDIVQCYNGKTIEILNTDAEGRLIMADAIAYSAIFKPNYILDFATLTGWAQNLHCDTSAIFFTANKKLHNIITDLGEDYGDRVWGMPRWLEYMKYTKSSIADYKNSDMTIHGCNAGSGFMAAMFLANFIPKSTLQSWVHFDIGNNIHNHILNTNSMILGIQLIKKLI